MNSIPTKYLHPFEHFVNQISLAADSNDLYFVALLSALALPDICGALESQDGLASGQKYQAWFNKWVSSKYQINGKSSLTGHDCYMLRCASSHQGRLTHPKGSYSGVIFLEPGNTRFIMHNNILNNYLNIDVRQFCTDLIQSSLDWFDSVDGKDPFERNYLNSMRWHENGFGPIGGASVIA
jgi:hypothetical protein